MMPDLIEERRERLQGKLRGLYEEYDRETRFEEKLRLKAIISDTKKDLQELAANSRATPTPSNIRIDRLPTVQGEFFGREAELQLLNDAWTNGKTNIIQFIAPGGTGKTKMLRYWLDQVRPEKLIAWSFYSQGASEEKQPSATLFYNLLFDLLDPSKTVTDFANQPEKMGEYLADLLRQQNCLLILDGFEPLQHSSAVLRGELKDRTLRALLKSLAAHHASLCIITTRIAIRELSGHSQPVVISHDLQNLAEQDGVKLLKSLNVTGSDTALLKAVNEYGRHALALHLLGNALTIYLDGDILKRDTLDELFGEEAYTDVERHAFKVMQAYKTWLKDTPELQLLYLLSLFDHPIEAEVLEVLWKAQIPGLTDKIPLKAWKVAIRDLREKHRLLSTHEGRPDLLDCHPLLREYFGKQLQIQRPKAWQQAHKKLYEYYNALPKKTYPDTLEEMRPLFHAVTHGCAAGLHQRVVTEVYYSRIERKEEFYNVKKLGAFNDDLAAIACFFTEVWKKPSAKLPDIWQLRLLGYAGFCLRALGRLHEALEPMAANVALAVKQKNWKEAAIGASNLSELQLTLGDVAQAVESGARSSRYADQSGDMFLRMGFRATHADALHQAGDTAAALALFREAEQLQQERQPEFPRLYSLPGFRYCDLLLAQGSTAEVLERAEYDLDCWTNHFRNGSLLDFSLPKLTLGRAHLQQLLPPSTSGRGAGGEGLHWLEQAVAGLRAAGDAEMVALGLLARAALHRHTHEFTRARQDLQKVFDIAEPSGMQLHLTDYHLEMARLLVAETLTPTPLPPSGRGAKTGESASCPPSTAQRERGAGGEGLQYHVAEAERLINETGYHRRDAELAELQQQLAKGNTP
ncbi:MAG: hypothetical protein PHE17_05850 [Thiothrix sp.]|uniref:hypothetical protein n=1 Tax=Thiothrix sp. TaxID=1032 RepID=UPI0026029AF9|nr:hypothetical protein [Thiothrix sp.]MDD5392523.1 hypothetical protein [Thiothrix sp.]